MQRFYRLVIGIGAALSGLVVPSCAQELRFVKETIAVSVLVPDTVKVTGDYFFTAADSSAAAARTPLFYPFPIDSSGEYPCFIEVKNARSGKAIEFGRGDQGIMFPVDARASDTTAVTVVYKQRVKNRGGRYILTTTGIWGHPLIDSRYSVSVPDNTTLNFMSYECDSVASTGSRLVYHFFKKKFMPDRDLSFTWTCPSEKPAGKSRRR